jgi:TRAP-type C4-dicarboxylate transport system substrate-binding protein
MIHVISVSSWQKLTPEQQKIIREESTSAGNLMRKLIDDQEADQLVQIKSHGVQVTEPDRALFRAKMGPAWKSVADYAGADNVKKFTDMVDATRKA